MYLCLIGVSAPLLSCSPSLTNVQKKIKQEAHLDHCSPEQKCLTTLTKSTINNRNRKKFIFNKVSYFFFMKGSIFYRGVGVKIYCDKLTIYSTDIVFLHIC